MSTYEPGRVYVATVRGKKDVRVFRMAQVSEHHTYLWATAVAVGSTSTFTDDEVTDVRPLVVLDLDFIRYEPYGLPAVLGDLRGGNVGGAEIARQIEAQTKPPRIPEPGLWGVVEANQPVHGNRIEWTHGPANAEGNDWHAVEGDWHRVWSDLTDPVLIRPGIEDES